MKADQVCEIIWHGSNGLAREGSPHLEGVFGALSQERDTSIKAVLGRVDAELLSMADAFGLKRAGWEGTGLDLVLCPSGQLEISSFVEPTDAERQAASFQVGLRPSWFYGQRTDRPGWIVEVRVEVDCGHRPAHDGMHVIHEREVEAATPEQAADALLRETERLSAFARTKPLAEWVAAGKLGGLERHQRVGVLWGLDLERDVEQMIAKVGQLLPSARWFQLQVAHPGGDDDGLWTFEVPNGRRVQVESPNGSCPFLIEGDDSDERSPGSTVLETVEIVVRRLMSASKEPAT
jgi:hypothetical protein